MLIGIVTSRFNSEITEKLRQGAKHVLQEARVEILEMDVPGAVEIPLAAQALLQKGCAGVVALGAVIRGETTHYEMVCDSVNIGLTQLILQTQKPIGMGVLTCENEEQAEQRVGGVHGHKGMEAAQVVLEMIEKLNRLQQGENGF